MREVPLHREREPFVGHEKKKSATPKVDDLAPTLSTFAVVPCVS